MGRPDESERNDPEVEAGEEGAAEPPDGSPTATEPDEDEEAAAQAVEEGLAQERAVADELMAELERLKDRHLRLAAEFENYRKRTRQELLKTRQMAQADLAGRLLDALDDLRRIAEVPEDSATVEALHEGVALVERKVLKELGEAGLEPIEAEGERFDPTEHEALSSVPTDDPEQDQVVADVFVRGYRFGDRLLRPARVAVRMYQPGAVSGEGEEGRGDGGSGSGDAGT